MTIAAIGGAGDVGKTTILELVGKHFTAQMRPVLTIDANPDQTLLSFAGIDDKAIAVLPQLCNGFDEVKQILEGDNPFYTDKTIVCTSPVTEHTKRWRFDIPDDLIISRFAVRGAGGLYMHTGTYTSEDIGTGCLHSKIENLVFTLERLDDGMNGEYGIVMVDQAHGRDAFGTPLYAQGDIILVVAQPNRKSLDIMADYLSMAREIEGKTGHKINVGIIGNRVEDEYDIAAIKNVAGTAYIASLYLDPALRRKNSNKGPTLDELLPQNREAITQIANTIQTAERDWNRRKAWLELCHFNAEWYDTSYGTEVRKQRTSFVMGHGNHGPNCNCGSH